MAGLGGLANLVRRWVAWASESLGCMTAVVVAYGALIFVIPERLFGTHHVFGVSLVGYWTWSIVQSRQKKRASHQREAEPKEAAINE
jgi:hypothetical protein